MGARVWVFLVDESLLHQWSLMEQREQQPHDVM
jgi:hypothetical protein